MPSKPICLALIGFENYQTSCEYDSYESRFENHPSVISLSGMTSLSASSSKAKSSAVVIIVSGDKSACEISTISPFG